MATTSPSSAPAVRDIERELRYAKSQLHDAFWEENEEMQRALQRQIDRLEMLLSLGERYDIDH